MPRVPIVDARLASLLNDKELMRRAKLGAKSPRAASGPSAVQKAAATRVADLYSKNIDDPRYRKNMLGPQDPDGEIAWQTK